MSILTLTLFIIANVARAFLTFGFTRNNNVAFRQNNRLDTNGRGSKFSMSVTVTVTTLKESNEVISGFPSDKLVSLLKSSDPSVVNDPDLSKKLEEMINELADLKVQFDPQECLNGPFFCTMYQGGPTPLWEKFSLVKSNKKGQQYCIDREDTSPTVFNYSEIFGEKLYLSASGNFRRANALQKDDNDGESTGLRTTPKSLFSGLASFFNSNKVKNNSKAKKGSLLLECPEDYTVTVTKASVVVLDNAFELPVQGTGYLRVLYADSVCRIFTSPKDTTQTKWESKGLRVVQIRSDLIDPSFVLPSTTSK